MANSTCTEFVLLCILAFLTPPLLIRIHKGYTNIKYLYIHDFQKTNPICRFCGEGWIVICSNNDLVKGQLFKPYSRGRMCATLSSYIAMVKKRFRYKLRGKNLFKISYALQGFVSFPAITGELTSLFWL